MTKPDQLDLMVVAGSPGAGKTTLCDELRARWGIVPMIDLGDLRNFHLDRLWVTQSERDLAIAFDHLVYIVHSYARHEWTPVLVNDLREEWVARTHEFFGDLRYVIVTLFASNEASPNASGDGMTASRTSPPLLPGTTRLQTARCCRTRSVSTIRASCQQRPTTSSTSLPVWPEGAASKRQALKSVAVLHRFPRPPMSCVDGSRIARDPLVFWRRGRMRSCVRPVFAAVSRWP